MTETATLGRAVTVIGVATASLAGLLAFLLPDLAAGRGALPGAGPGSASFEALLVRGCAVAALLAAAWLWAVTCAVALAAARGRPGGAVPGVPACVRRLVLLACGVALVGSVSAPAGAAPAAEPAPVSIGRHDQALLAGLPLPDRATGVAPAAPHAGRRVVVVRPGDTLWDLAARRLPSGVGAAEVTAGWHRIHELNRRVIGDDPDLIHPGQRLRLPRR